jgi:2-dehydro-3-deoxyphosphogluconate aldolase/(4S)-4-hydroxy-2-oxoglutarate aldolase
MIPGAFSPTEIVNAWQAGASCVKVFPISTLGGVAYVKSLQGPLGEIPLIPTGGVTLKNAEAFIEAGAIAVGLSSELFPPALLSEQNWQAIAKQAEILTQQLAKI